MQISGASDNLQATRDALSANFVIAVLVSYLLLVAIFSHWGYPLIIMLTVPIGISGGIVGLWLMNFIGARLDQIGLSNIHQPSAQLFDEIFAEVRKSRRTVSSPTGTDKSLYFVLCRWVAACT